MIQVIIEVLMARTIIEVLTKWTIIEALMVWTTIKALMTQIITLLWLDVINAIKKDT